MPDLIKGIDNWALALAALGFLYLANRTFTRFDNTLDKFGSLFEELFKNDKDQESRISKLEGKCESNHP